MIKQHINNIKTKISWEFIMTSTMSTLRSGRYMQVIKSLGDHLRAIFWENLTEPGSDILRFCSFWLFCTSGWKMTTANFFFKKTLSLLRYRALKFGPISSKSAFLNKKAVFDSILGLDYYFNVLKTYFLDSLAKVLPK